MADVVMQLERCAEEYRTDFLPFLEQQKRTKEQRARESAEAQLERFKRDYDPSVQAAALAAAVARGSTAGKSVSGGQETVSGGQETVSGGQETVSGGQETVSGSQETVSGGQETVSGGQETVSGGQETVTSSPKRQDDLAEVGASEA
ncbi:putative ATP binding protein [Toxoplasma gondii VAND]|uniref:Putative ATP binding protein n=1 Tax=Toxoplasma gondii VAND TaxID=933077 RepID=A0A086Q6T0_TOXGO|nr:putative ATP binding protein [Toxoplasma gondii VAND]